MSFFEKQVGKVVFFTKNSPKYFAGDYSLILSPQFYWIKRVKLPVKSEYKAKKLAPSVFEGSLPEGETYFYDVKYEKDRDSFIVIAYSKEHIYKAIKEKFSSTSKILGIYFAQYELKDLDTCIAIDEEISLGNVDGLLIQVPSSCVQSEENVKKYLPKVKLSSKKIKIENFIDNDIKNYIYYFIFLGLFVLSQMITYIAYNHDLSKYNDMRNNLIIKYHLPKTTFQLNSIKKSLQKELKEQKAIKNALLKLDKIVFNSNEKYMNIVITKNSATFHIKTTKDRAETLLTQFKQRFSVTSANFADDILKLEVNL
jgi:hypothetical protein